MERRGLNHIPISSVERDAFQREEGWDILNGRILPSHLRTHKRSRSADLLSSSPHHTTIVIWDPFKFPEILNYSESTKARE